MAFSKQQNRWISQNGTCKSAKVKRKIEKTREGVSSQRTGADWTATTDALKWLPRNEQSLAENKNRRERERERVREKAKEIWPQLQYVDRKVFIQVHSISLGWWRYNSQRYTDSLQMSREHICVWIGLFESASAPETSRSWRTCDSSHHGGDLH